MRHAGSEPAEDIRHRNAKPPNTGAPTPLAGFNRDNFPIIHGATGTPPLRQADADEGEFTAAADLKQDDLMAGLSLGIEPGRNVIG